MTLFHVPQTSIDQSTLLVISLDSFSTYELSRIISPHDGELRMRALFWPPFMTSSTADFMASLSASLLNVSIILGSRVVSSWVSRGRRYLWFKCLNLGAGREHENGYSGNTCGVNYSPFISWGRAVCRHWPGKYVNGIERLNSFAYYIEQISLMDLCAAVFYDTVQGLAYVSCVYSLLKYGLWIMM